MKIGNKNIFFYSIAQSGNNKGPSTMACVDDTVIQWPCLFSNKSLQVSRYRSIIPSNTLKYTVTLLQSDIFQSYLATYF